MTRIFALCLLSLVLSIVYGFTDEQLAEIKELSIEAGQECMVKENLSDDDIQTLRQHQIPSTHSGKCYFRCMLEYFGIITDGKASRDRSFEKALEILQDDAEKIKVVMKVYDECFSHVGEINDPCEDSIHLVMCGQSKKDEFGLDAIVTLLYGVQ